MVLNVDMIVLTRNLRLFSMFLNKRTIKFHIAGDYFRYSGKWFLILN